MADTSSDKSVGLGRILSDLYPHFETWSPRFVRDFGNGDFSHQPDVVSVCAETTFTVLTDGSREPAGPWYAYLYGACRKQALAYFESPAVTPASGMTAVMRRRRQAIGARNLMTMDSGSEPTPTQVVESVNTDLLARRVDAGRQSALLTVDDFAAPTSNAELHEHDLVNMFDGAVPLSSFEARDLIQMLIETCDDISTELGVAAALFVGETYSEPPVMRGPGEIAGLMSVAPLKASRLLAKVKAVAVELCEQQFGISSPF